jgi:hypothetical protein
MKDLKIEQNCVLEIDFYGAKGLNGSFFENSLQVVFTGENKTFTIPGFWRGENRWSVRFSSPECGLFSWTSVFRGADPELHNVTGKVMVVPYTGKRVLYKRGGITVAEDRNHFEYADKAPFFYLADTWWNGMSDRMEPGGFKKIAEDRTRKGFTAIQLCIGLLPIMSAFDNRAKNKEGFTWKEDMSSVNPEYFDICDAKLRCLINQDLVPCIFGAWGYNVFEFGKEKLIKHWEYIIARWSPYRVMWCLAGEGDMPWFLSKTREEDKICQRRIWTEIGTFVKLTDPYNRPVTIHPTMTENAVDDPVLGDCLATNVVSPEILDFEMLQTGHFKINCMAKTKEAIDAAVKRNRNKRPILNGEVCYEGMFDDSSASDQRFFMSANILNGANAGYAYGASGIWEANTQDCAAGISPDGINWSDTVWQKAMYYEGSNSVGIIKRLFEEFDWWNIEKHPEWLEDSWNGENYKKSVAGGVPGKYRFFYLIAKTSPFGTVLNLEKDIIYECFFYCPVTGKRSLIGNFSGDKEGKFIIPMPPLMHDWIFVMKLKE